MFPTIHLRERRPTLHQTLTRRSGDRRPQARTVHEVIPEDEEPDEDDIGEDQEQHDVFAGDVGTYLRSEVEELAGELEDDGATSVFSDGAHARLEAAASILVGAAEALEVVRKAREILRGRRDKGSGKGPPRSTQRAAARANRERVDEASRRPDLSAEHLLLQQGRPKLAARTATSKDIGQETQSARCQATRLTSRTWTTTKLT